jgi:predicted DNA-binding protein
MKNKKSTINIRLENDLKERYLLFCENNGYSISKRIRKLIENDMNNDKFIRIK